MYKSLIRPIFFRFDPEKVHNVVMKMMDWSKPVLAALTAHTDSALGKTIMGIDFPNPIGLAAGFDKNAAHIDAFAALGFGFIEIGTVTPRPQPGNPRPRLFRLPQDSAIINRMGFNNAGVDAVVENICARKSNVIIGGNIGKNKTTPNDKAVDDYLVCLERLHDYVDYFVVNVSSPNTPGLRELQDKEPLKRLLATLQDRNASKSSRKPLLLKIAPDLNEAQLDDIVAIAGEVKLDGIVATNTTISREALVSSQHKVQAIGAGGLSGAPLKSHSNEILRQLRKNLPKGFPLIGVGGIMNAADALEKFNAGADLIQAYTGLIYDGPFLVRRIKRQMLKADR